MTGRQRNRPWDFVERGLPRCFMANPKQPAGRAPLYDGIGIAALSS